MNYFLNAVIKKYGSYEPLARDKDGNVLSITCPETGNHGLVITQDDHVEELSERLGTPPEEIVNGMVEAYAERARMLDDMTNPDKKYDNK